MAYSPHYYVLQESDKSSGGRGSKVTSAAASRAGLANAAFLLGVGEPELEQVLTSHTLSIRNEKTMVLLDKKGAADCRNALAKTLYGRMFDWLVQHTNELIARAASADRVRRGSTGDHDDTTGSVGILDIFGFEIFKVTSKRSNVPLFRVQRSDGRTCPSFLSQVSDLGGSFSLVFHNLQEQHVRAALHQLLQREARQLFCTRPSAP